MPVDRGRPAVWVRLDRDLPDAAGQVRSVTLLYEAGRLWGDATAEVHGRLLRGRPGAGAGPGRGGGSAAASTRMRSPGADCVGPVVTGRATRAEHRMHLADTQGPPAGRWPAAPPSRG